MLVRGGRMWLASLGFPFTQPFLQFYCIFKDVHIKILLVFFCIFRLCLFLCMFVSHAYWLYVSHFYHNLLLPIVWGVWWTGRSPVLGCMVPSVSQFVLWVAVFAVFFYYIIYVYALCKITNFANTHVSFACSHFKNLLPCKQTKASIFNLILVSTLLN